MIPLSDTVQRRHVPWMTWLLIGTNLWAFLVELLVDPGRRAALIGRFGLVPAAPTAMTFVTHTFLHLGPLHVVLNVWFLWLFGASVEDRMGPFRFLVFYLLCGLAAAGLHVKTYESLTLPAVGASGAIAGVMGAFIALFPRARVHAFVLLPGVLGVFTIPALVYLGSWFLLQFLHGWSADHRGVVESVAWWAHAGGFMTGCLCVLLFVRRDRWSRGNPGYAD